MGAEGCGDLDAAADRVEQTRPHRRVGIEEAFGVAEAELDEVQAGFLEDGARAGALPRA